jgi:hypothetical protein
MMTLKQSLLDAIKNLPSASYIRPRILRSLTMSACQKFIAAVYAITNREPYGFYVAEEHVLIERIIEVAEMPFTEESVDEIKSRLAMPTMTTMLKAIGVEITRHHGSYFTVWGPGVRRG